MKSNEKECMVCMSLKWKESSYEALSKSKGDKEAFAEAVLECGRGGHVLRTVSEEDRPFFCSWVLEHYDMIIAGTLKISDVPRFGDKTPKSWVSKICHILNPWDYPIIYDTHIREQLGVTERTWQSAMEKRRKSKNEASRMELYEYDSRLWAGVL